MEKSYYIYKHTSPNGKIYIGVTCKSPKRRWNNGKGYAKNKHFYSAIQKYGWENIKHEIIADGLTKEEASQKEKDLILLYKSNDPKFGYNNTSGGYDGYELSDTQIEALKDRTRKQFNDDEFKTKFNSLMRDPERRKRVSEGLKQYYESQEAREKASKAQKKKWESEEYRERFKQIARKRSADPEYKRKLSRVLTEKRSSEEYKQSMTGGNNPNARSILQYSLCGELIEKFNSIEDACRKYDCNHSNIIACINGRTKTSYGFIWVYDGDEEIADKRSKILRAYVNPKSKPIFQCDSSGQVIKRFQSVSKAAACLNASAGTICMALNGKRKTAYGYTWKYAD